MPAYHAERTIGEAIESVLAQTYDDWELIVIAEDEPSAIAAEQYKDDRITVLRNEKRLGAAGSRNRGISESRGEWLAFLDADDMWTEEKLERQLKFMEEHGAEISYTASAFFNSKGEFSEYVMPAEYRLSYSELLRRNLMSCSSVIVTSKLGKSVMFEEGNLREDWLFWLKALKSTTVSYGLNEPLLKYRISSTSESSKKMRILIGTYNTYRKSGINTLSSCKMTLYYLLYSIKKRKRIGITP